MGSFDQWCWKSCFMLTQRNTKPKPQSLPFCESRDKPWTDFTSNQTKHTTWTKSWNHPDSNVSPAVVVAEKIFKWQSLTFKLVARLIQPLPSLTCHVLVLGRSPVTKFTPLQTAGKCTLTILSSSTCLPCWSMCVSQNLGLWNPWTNKPVAHSSALPYLRPRHPGNALTAEGGGPP